MEHSATAPPENTTLQLADVRAALQAWPGFEAIGQATADIPAGQVFLAGGALRSLALSGAVHTKDLDFFVSAAHSGPMLAKLAASGELTHGPFGSPRWRPADCATYIDVMVIEQFDNGVEPCHDITGVLRQFDFTANAIAMDLQSGQVFDPVAGLTDCRDRMLRAVRLDYPDEPFAPGGTLTRMDVLWMRLVHYAHKLRFAIAPTTLAWLLANQHRQRHANAFAQLFFPVAPQAVAAMLTQQVAPEAP